MIDAGYNYARLQEKMGWLVIDPATIQHTLISHQDTNHVGALETDSEQLFKDATVYIDQIENRYLTGKVRRKVFHGAYKLPMVRMENKKVLLRDGELFGKVFHFVHVIRTRSHDQAGHSSLNTLF